MKKILLICLNIAMITTLLGCQNSKTKIDIPLTLNEKFYDSQSVHSGQLTGLIKYLIFTSTEQGEIHYYQRQIDYEDWNITHYKYKFRYTVIDEETVFLTIGTHDIEYFDDNTNYISTKPLKTEMLMISKDMIYGSDGTHYVRYDYLVKHDYIKDDKESQIYFDDINFNKNALSPNATFIIKNVSDLNNYKNQFNPPFNYVMLPYRFFEKQGVYVVLHIQIDVNTSYIFDRYTYEDQTLHIYLKEISGTNNNQQSMYVYVRCYIFNTIQTVTYTIDS